MDPTTFRLLMCAADDDTPPVPGFPGSFFANQTNSTFSSNQLMSFDSVTPAVDGSGDIFVTGNSNNRTISTNVVARFKSDGTAVWARTYRFNTSSGTKMCAYYPVQSPNTKYLIFYASDDPSNLGVYSSDIIVAVDPWTGAVVWQWTIAPSGGTPGSGAGRTRTGHVYGIVADSNGFIYVAGEAYPRTTNVGGLSTRAYDGFIAKLSDTNGFVVTSRRWAESAQVGDPTSGTVFYWAGLTNLTIDASDNIFATQIVGGRKSGAFTRNGYRAVRLNTSCVQTWASDVYGTSDETYIFFAGAISGNPTSTVVAASYLNSGSSLISSFDANIIQTFDKSTGAIGFTKQLSQTGTRGGKRSKVPQALVADSAGNVWLSTSEKPNNTTYPDQRRMTLYKFDVSGTLSYANTLQSANTGIPFIPVGYGDSLGGGDWDILSPFVAPPPPEGLPYHNQLILDGAGKMYLTGQCTITDVRQPIGSVGLFAEGWLAKLPTDGTGTGTWVTGGAVAGGYANTFQYQAITTGITMPNYGGLELLTSNTTQTINTATYKVPYDSLVTTPLTINLAGYSQTLGTVAPVTINPADILVQFNPTASFASQVIGNIQAYGIIQSFSSTVAPGISGSIMPNGQTLRFGQTADPGDPSRTVYVSSVLDTDPLTAGAVRSETAFDYLLYGIPLGTKFYHAFRIKIEDWKSTTDEQLVMQWNAGGTVGLQPIYSMLITAGQLRFVLRYNTSATPSTGTTTAVVPYVTSAWEPDTWLDVVIEAKASINAGDQPYLRTWINGVQVVNYTGPVGYVNNPTYQTPYAKHGVYHWTVGNPWDLTLPQRTAYYGRAVIVDSGTYTVNDLSNYIDQP